ncbi:MAG: uL15 family ribosomal protein [Nanoarchaeota archaeon]
MGLKLKRRKKSGRFRGSHTHGRGGKKKARGSGHRGGFGMAGTGKRGDQRKTLILKKTLDEEYFGKRQTRMRFRAVKLSAINLERISIESFVKKGIAKEHNGVLEMNLKNHKIIGELSLPLKLKIHAGAASAGAVESVKKHGGEIIIGKN